MVDNEGKKSGKASMVSCTEDQFWALKEHNLI